MILHNLYFVVRSWIAQCHICFVSNYSFSHIGAGKNAKCEPWETFSGTFSAVVNFHKFCLNNSYSFIKRKTQERYSYIIDLWCLLLKRNIAVCPGSVGIELTFTRNWLGRPKQPIKWDILYHAMSCSVFKWGAGWRRGFCYSGASWALGGENTACYICFSSVLLIVVFFSVCHSVKLFSSQRMTCCLFSFRFSFPSHQGGGRSERVTVWFFVWNWGKNKTLW